VVKDSVTLTEKADFRQALGLIAIAAVIAIVLAAPPTWQMIATIASEILSSGQIFNFYTNGINTPTMYVKLMDGSLVGFVVLLECSGIIGAAIYTLLIASTMGLLRGSFSFKVGWLFVGIIIGFIWNITRLVIVVSTAYYFGMQVFTFIHYILAPFIDFLWMVAIWSFGISFLKRRI
jgi:exosortase/archaeosortase family protein